MGCFRLGAVCGHSSNTGGFRPNAAARSLAKPSVRPSVGHKARLEPRPLNPLGRAHREQQVDRRHWDGEIAR